MENLEEEPPELMEYLDEELPEIEITELVSAQDIYEYSQDQKKGINVLNPADILLQLTMLLQSKARAKGFLKLHQEILTEESFDPAIPEVHLQRIDAGNEEEFFNSLTEANKIDNYHTRQQELHKAFLGYETTKETPPALTDITTPTTIFLHYQPSTQSTILPEDNLSPTIKKYHPRTGIPPMSPHFLSLRLADRITEKTTFTTPTTPILTELTDLYTLWKKFMQQNITLDQTSFQTLQEQLQQLKYKEEEIYTFLTETKTYQSTLPELEESGGLAFYSLQRQIYLALRPILDQLQVKLKDLYQTYLQSLSANVATLTEELPASAYDLFQELLNNNRSVQDTINLLKLQMLKQQQKYIQAWLQTIHEWDIPALESKVEQNYQRYLQTTTSSQDEPLLRFASINEHIKEVLKGEIIVKTEEEIYLPATKEEEILLEKEDPNEITLPIFEEPTVTTLSLDHLNEGQKELFQITYRMLYNLHKASGLPLDIERLATSVPPTYRKTKLANIQDQLPSLAPELQSVVSQLDETQINAVIDIPSTRATLQEIQKEFLKDQREQLMYLLAWWILDLHHHVLKRTLHFEIWKGAANCIPAWSPYGYPLEATRKKEGLLPYLQCVIEDLTQLEGTSWHTYFTSNLDLAEQLTPIFQTTFAEQVTTMQNEFKSFDKELPLKNLKARGLAVKEDIETIVKQREKAKYLQEYMKFLKNLPSVLIQSSIAKRIYSGCCLQLLSEKFASDYDWAAYVKDAYKLKKLFATQKLEKEPKLTQYKPKQAPLEQVSSPIISNVSYLETPAIPHWTLEAWTPELEKYMPTPISTQNLPTYTEKNLALFTKSIKNTLLAPFVANANVQVLQQLYRKILQVQQALVIEIENPTEHTFIATEFNKLHPLNALLLSSQDYYTEVQELIRKRILQFFISRQICFPAKPEFARNNTLVLLETNLSGSFLNAFLQATYDKVLPWIKEKQFNQTTNFLEYIAKMREQENNAKLQIIDRMDPEERKLYVEAKKLGIFELQEYLQQFKREPEPQGEEYVDLGENNDEMDMDEFYDDEV